jgi:DNA-binding transcriptional ArsR family regulator
VKRRAILEEEEGCRVRVVHMDRVRRARKEAVPEADAERLVRTFQVLGDPTRMKIILALASGEMCVCDLAAYLNLTESAVSHQLRRMRDLGLVAPRRDGQVLYYKLVDPHAAALLKTGLNHVRK